MLEPQHVQLIGRHCEMSVETGRYSKRLSDLASIFQDKAEVQRLIALENPLIYEVTEFRSPDSDLVFGTTVMQPGRVGSEFFMTRGHYHQDRSCGEVYITQSGCGVLLLENDLGENRRLELLPGSIAFVPPEWAHRSVNTGQSALAFLWVVSAKAGNDYSRIAQSGFRQAVLAERP